MTKDQILEPLVIKYKIIIIKIYFNFFQRKIVEAEGAVNTEFNLYCSGVLLENDASVGDLTSNILELTVSLPGGKF